MWWKVVKLIDAIFLIVRAAARIHQGQRNAKSWMLKQWLG
jgi:hypothetical protein